jgi:3-oxoadipate enol-lactonase
MPRALVNGTNLYFEVRGRGEPLLLIQGLAGGANAWFRQVSVFEKYYTVIVFDARGLDRSDLSAVPYTLPVMVGDVIGLLDHLNIKKAHILGTSLGGLIAQAIAVDYPDRIMKLLLVSTFAGTDILTTSPALVQVNNFSLGMHSNETLKYFVSLAFNKPFYRESIRILSLFRPRFVYEGYFTQMRTMGEFSMVDRLHLLKAPTLIMTGSEDKIVPCENSRLLASRIPHSKLLIVEDGSHAFFLEMAGRFNTEVLRFLGE